MLSPEIVDFDDLAHDLGMSGDLEQELLSLAVEAPVVLIIDQLDAVSEVMDQSSQRMQVLLRLASRLQEAESQEGNKLPVTFSCIPGWKHGMIRRARSGSDFANAAKARDNSVTPPFSQCFGCS